MNLRVAAVTVCVWQQEATLLLVFVSCSSNRQLLFCGMHSGSIRVYPLQRGDLSLRSMHAYWTLSLHDNQSGHLKHIRSSYDDQFVLTAGDDGNIFSFALLPPEGRRSSRQRRTAVIPPPRVSLHPHHPPHIHQQGLGGLEPGPAPANAHTHQKPPPELLKSPQSRLGRDSWTAVHLSPTQGQAPAPPGTPVRHEQLEENGLFHMCRNRSVLRTRLWPRTSTTQQPTG